MIHEDNIINYKTALLATTQAVALFVILLFVHELGHLILYNITHTTVATMGFDISIGAFVQYPTPVDSFSNLVTWGGFIATLIFIPFYKRYNITGKFMVYIMVAYGFVEGIVQARYYSDGIDTLNTIVILVVIIPLFIAIIIWGYKMLKVD